MLASEITNRAIDLADLQNSDFILYRDKINSLNESHRDIYEELVDNDDDYYLSETIFGLTPAQNTGQPNEYLVSLPADCYKIRYVDYKLNGQWQRMAKMPLSSKDLYNGSPMYRWSGAKLWLIGADVGSAQIRVGYYPAPSTVSTPDKAYEYGTALPDYAISNITYSFYVPQNKTLIYVYNGNSIVAQSLDLGTTITLKTGLTAPKKVWYYRGWLYWLDGTNLTRAQSDLTSAIAGGTVIISGTCQNYGIYGDFIYYSEAVATKVCGLDGTGSVGLLAFATVDCQPYGANQAYIKTGTLWINGTDTLYPATQFVLQGNEFLWLNAIGTVARGTWSGTAFGTLATYKTTVNYLGDSIEGGYLPIIGSFGAWAFSTAPDTEFSYPANAVWELMAYQMAADFMRKGKQDFTIILQRREELLARFRTQIRRDDYQPQRINNAYQTNNFWGQ